MIPAKHLNIPPSIAPAGERECPMVTRTVGNGGIGDELLHVSCAKRDERGVDHRDGREHEKTSGANVSEALGSSIGHEKRSKRSRPS